jgi:hypothetical protein
VGLRAHPGVNIGRALVAASGGPFERRELRIFPYAPANTQVGEPVAKRSQIARI